MHRSLFLLPASLLLFGACLDIKGTPVSASGGSGGQDNGAGSGNEGGVPIFDATPCVQQCVDMTPSGTRNFAAVAACNEDARVNACAEACSGAALDGDPAGATCAVPGNVDPVPACNTCIKQSCCDTLSRCFSDIACITVGICASGCPG